MSIQEIGYAENGSARNQTGMAARAMTRTVSVLLAIGTFELRDKKRVKSRVLIGFPLIWWER